MSTTSSDAELDFDESYDSMESNIEDFVEEMDVEEDSPRHTFFDGSCLTTMQAYLLIYQFVMRHSLSNRVFSELLLLLSVLLPKGTSLPRSTYLFKKFMVELFPCTKARSHYYCTSCQSPLQSALSPCANCSQADIGQFITAPLGPQIKQLIEGNYISISQASIINYIDPASYKSLQQRFNRSPGTSDIYDGLGYQKHGIP